MTRTRSTLVVLALLVLALPVITGATTASDAQEGIGDANASLLGAALEVEDLDGLTAGVLGEVVGDLALLDAIDTSGLGALDTRIDLGLIEGLTAATTRDVPDARSALSPLRIGDDRPHDVSAGPGESAGGDAVTPAPVSALLSSLGVSAFGVSADADDDGAIARIDALDATIDALSVTSLDIGLTEVVSEVTRTGSSATQDLTVDGLAVGLGDILPAELLEALPLDALLDLITELGDAGLLSGVDGLQAQILGLIASIEATLDDLAGVDLDLADLDGDLLTDIGDLLTALDDLEDLDLGGLLGAASAQGDAQAQVLGGIGDVADDIGGAIDDVTSGVTDSLNLGDLDLDLDELGLTDVELLLLEDVLNTLLDLEDLVGGVVDLTGTCLDDLASIVDDPAALQNCVNEVIGLLTDTLDDLLGDVLGDLGLQGVLDDLLALLGDLSALEDLLDTLPGLIDQIASLDLLTADTMGLEVLAAADAEGGSTTIACELGGLAILGEVIGDTTCTDGSLDGDTDGAVAGALATLTGVLESLPGVSGIDGLSLDILPVATEDVTTAEDGTVTARAHAVLLELSIPSVTIDPDPSALLDDLLALDLSIVDDVVGQVDDLLAGVGLGGVLPTEQLTVITALIEEEVLSVLGGTVDELLAQVTGLLDGILDLDILDGLLIPVSTPAISLVLDPVSEATFTPAADPGDDPTPVDDDPTPVTDDPELPKTGGGLALLGLLAMLGALGLRRTG